jgi:hypothetical protein
VATVSFTIATTSISKSCQEVQGPQGWRWGEGPVVWGWGCRAGHQGRQRCPHPSPFDGISQKPHNIVPFCSRGLEALGPVEEDALWGEEDCVVAGLGQGATALNQLLPEPQAHVSYFTVERC